MKHYVLFKFKSGYYNENIFEYTKEVFDSIKEKVDGIKSVNVYRNCVARDSNMDMMIEMELENRDMLALYLNDELHKAFVDRTDDHLVLRVSFDYEDNKSGGKMATTESENEN